MVLAEALGEDGVPRAREDLRDRRRRGGAATRRATAPTRHEAVEDVPARCARALLRALRPALRVPHGPAARGDLRPQRPRAGRADLAHRPARLPQHAHVLQRRDAGADPAALPLRARRRRRARARQVGDAASRTPTCSARRTSSGGSSARSSAATMRDRVRVIGDGSRQRRRRRARPARAARAARSTLTPQRAGRHRPGRRPRDGQRPRAPDVRARPPRTSAAPLQDLELSYRPVELRSRDRAARASDRRRSRSTR